MGIVFDLDQTLVNSALAAQHRKNRNWQKVYSTIPQFTIYEGVDEVLDFIDRHKLQTVIVSTSPKPYCERVVSHFKFKINHIIGYYEARPIKPHAAPMLKALQLLGMKANQVISIGDRVIDIESSKNAGILSVGSLWGSDEKDALIKSNPHFLIKNPTEFIPILQRHFNLS
jgi:HAD superfamily hydrolase (TIGR01549 family)